MRQVQKSFETVTACRLLVSIALVLICASCTTKPSPWTSVQISDGRTMGTMSISEETSGGYRINIREKMCLVESPSDFQERELFISGKQHSTGFWVIVAGLIRLMSEI